MDRPAGNDCEPHITVMRNVRRAKRELASNGLMPAPAGCGQPAHCREVLFILAPAPMG
jgi:hypothetical protein